jgi:hypothetical protein
MGCERNRDVTSTANGRTLPGQDAPALGEEPRRGDTPSGRAARLRFGMQDKAEEATRDLE